MATVSSTLPANLPPSPPCPSPACSPAATSTRNRKPLAATPGEQLSLQPSEAAALLTAAARSRDLRLGRAFHARLLRAGDLLEADAVVANSLLTLYSKCGAVSAARSVFDGMPGGLRDLVSWTAMASCLARNGSEAEALRLFSETLKAGLLPNAFTLCATAQACFVRELFQLAGGAVLGFVFKMGLWGTDVSVGCSLIDMFAKNGDMVAARRVFDGLVERTVVVWTLLITRYAQRGYTDDAVELFVDMLENGFQPDQYTMSSILSACTELGSIRLGQQLHSLALRLGVVSDSCVNCGLVDMYAKSQIEQPMNNARKIFDRMPKRNVMSWTALLSGYVQCRVQENKVMALFCEMLNEGIRPNHITYSSLLKACANLSDKDSGRQIHAHCIKSNAAPVNVVGNALVSMYAESGCMEEARRAFNQLYEKNMFSFSSDFDRDRRNSVSQGYEIESVDVGISTFTFASLISAAASIGLLTRGQQLHAISLKTGFGSDRGIGNSLVSMYSRCGYQEDASRAFEEMNDRNVISWTSIISGLAKHGYAERALELFHDMISAGVKPNDVTYIAVLSACSHAGLVKEGKEHFRLMKDYGLIPRMEHYACVVDLLGRSGLVEEALDFINKMPCQPDALVWKTLLGTCKIHDNMDIGEITAHNVIKLEPQDPAPYVLLSNLYADAGLWDQVASIRSLMREKHLSKETGLSWMHLENTIHSFRAGDTTHPEAEKIYLKLDTLVKKIKGIGYVPDTSIVLHDMPKELKEQCLLQHSEKIAVAFGLISCTSATKPIRIFKNLRVCTDCHSALKYVTKVTGREIILRDSNRFHRMKDGKCSCGEYW